MPVFLVERNFVERLNLSADAVEQINDITNEIGVEWLSSFLSADGKKTYCLYEARDPEQLREHAKLVGIPADEIVQVDRFWPRPED
jgi:Nickel responsive protein SCO4226-like